MRLILFFDLPVTNSKQRRQYAAFRKKLINDGFIMMQESVYSKLSVNKQSQELEIKRLLKELPTDGLVQILTVTEKQFAEITTLVGKEIDHGQINSTDRLVIL